MQVAVGRLGPVKAGEFSTNVQNTTRDLLGSLPKGDRVYLEQMMFAAFCSSLQSDGSLTGKEKTRARRDYAREVRQTVLPASSPAPSPETRRGPSAPSPQPVKTGASDAAVTKQSDKKQPAGPLAKFAMGKKIFINYSFSTACAFWVRWDNLTEGKWTAISQYAGAGKGGYYLTYNQSAFYTKTPYIYVLALPGVNQADMYERGSQLLATSRLDEVRVPLTANDEGGAFTSTVTCP